MFTLFRNTLYIRIQPERIAILHVESDRELIDIPAPAVEMKGKQSNIVAVGQAAIALTGKTDISVRNGFRHPRTLLADFSYADRALRYLVKQALPKSWLVTSPIIIMHPQALLEGGLTAIETRAFAELGASAGARRVYGWVGAELTREELIALNFSCLEGQLLFPWQAPSDT
ncbi:MAG: rod shape-determining protein [Methylomonas sp.]|jgi:rod shape-determining protein MreB|uniref:rod shape-determining protein n=1 Tax=Methylomonas sp. TaxID=418 RepID=UPI0025E77CD9|nr:rod shape-determining protein [Methylomonas sp.]MCK9607577.1 rod shape-determining protein [Methylomonas sp.]